MKELTNLYQLAKTLKFDLTPIGQTAEVFRRWIEGMKKSELVVDKDGNLFAKDKNIKNAYLAIKPIMDGLHEQFIEKSLCSEEAKMIDFSKYFEAYRTKSISADYERELRGKIGATYEIAGAYFSAEIDKVIEGQKKKNKKSAKDENSKSKNKKPYECLTDAKMYNYLSANIRVLAQQNDIDEQTLSNHISQFKGFWGYLDGYNQNRENYYETDKEASTAVATRIVHDNLPTFCINILRFEKRGEEYLGIYQYLKDNNRETKNKDSKGEELDVEAISEKVFQIQHFNECLAQSQIEEYNRIIGNYNLQINLYNQLRRCEKDFKKIDEFEKLYKQIGCGKMDSKFETLQDDSNVKILLQKASEAGKRMFCSAAETMEIETVPSFITFLKSCDNWDGIYMSKTAIGQISNLYFANWHSIKDKLKESKADACITYDKNREEPIKLRDAVELSGLFAVLDSERPEFTFKESLFRDAETNDYRGILDKELSSSQNLIRLLCFDIERNIKVFLGTSNDIIALEKYRDENKLASEEDQTIKKIKDWFDAATDAMRIVRYFAVRKSKMKGNLPNTTLEQALSNLLYSDDARWFKWYDLIRNYLTKKQQDDVKENKLKLNFGSSSFLKETGWVNDYSKNGAFIVVKDQKYYLVVVNDKLTKEDIENLKTSSTDAKRVVYYHEKMDFKNFPRMFIYSTGDKLAQAVEKYKLPISSIQKDYDKYRTLKAKDKNIFIEENPKFRYNLIEYFKKGALLHESLTPYKDGFESVWKDTKQYNTLSEFYKDTINTCYRIVFENIDFERMCSMEKFYLFQIYSKDFSTGKNGGEGSIGTPNLHTIYWKMLFEESNLKDVIFKLDGQGAAIFMREPVAKKSPVVHRVGSKLVNKKDKDGKTIPEMIYREIYLYANGKTKDISAEAQKYMDKAVIKDVKHEIIKDKRFYGDCIKGSKYMFHCPITINFKAKHVSESEVNSIITDSLQQSESLHFIGVDRGEKHLVYSCTIDKDGKIIKCNHHDNINGTDYVQKLENVADERVIAKKNWQQQGKIKDLKNGYISHVVHSLVDEAIKDDGKIAPHAYIVLEDLSTEMKRSRQKFEKQVYQNLETALAKKLNFVVDKNAKQGELGSVSRALQLTPPISNYQDIEGKKQFGIMLYTRANYTSVTDPATGWRKTIYIKNGKEDDIKNQILEKFDDFGFDGKDYYFEYTEANAGYKWCLYSGKDGESLVRYQNKRQMLQDKNVWVSEQINVVNILDRLFTSFDRARSFKRQIEDGAELKKIDGRSETAWQSLRYVLDVIQQIRNSGEKNSKDDNFLCSPVRKNGEHFDTRNYKNNGELSEIRDADANGAYNIARKGLIMDAHIKYWIEQGRPMKSDKKGGKTSDLDLFISDEEWDLWLLNRVLWEKKLPFFASRRAKESEGKSQIAKMGKKKR